MRAIEFIRNLLDLMDNLENQDETGTDYEDEISEPSEQTTDFSNSPDELYVHTDAILTVGNDVNKPKHPSDLRSNSFSLYPNAQYDPRK